MIFTLILSGLCIGAGGGEVLYAAHESDPVLQEYLQKEGEGWRLANQDNECKPNSPLLSSECAKLVKSTRCDIPQDLALRNKVLYYCRRECRNLYKDVHNDDLPDSIQEDGGLGDLIDVEFGFKVPICNQREGWQKKGETIIYFKTLNAGMESMVVPFTKEGFFKEKIPESLYQELLKERQQILDTRGLEEEEGNLAIANNQALIVNDNLQQSKLMKIHRYQMMPVSDEVKETIFKGLGPLAEGWAQLKLLPTSIYGIRRYRNNSMLATHIDKTSTHVISAIMNIAQDVEEPWGLYIMDHEGAEHRVELEPGEMVWYESARLRHGRPQPLKGSYYDNIFIHYKPVGAWYKVDGSAVLDNEKISLERVQQSQLNYPATNWSTAWSSYLDFSTNKDLLPYFRNSGQGLFAGSDHAGEISKHIQ